MGTTHHNASDACHDTLMPVMLICDAPECQKTTPAVVQLGKPAAPPRWWMMSDTKTGRIVVACCDKHMVAASVSLEWERL